MISKKKLWMDLLSLKKSQVLLAIEESLQNFFLLYSYGTIPPPPSSNLIDNPFFWISIISSFKLLEYPMKS